MGCGSGGIAVMTSIVIGDLVPLAERSLFLGIQGICSGCVTQKPNRDLADYGT
jgi:hypothetical protein